MSEKPNNELLRNNISKIENEMESSYLAYAMSVITSRAIPDIRDGLKPVHRRILYAMYEIGCDYNKPYKKCAKTVGDVMGKYHPHGDSSIYEALVRMGQSFSMGQRLIDGQGNFGSVDGDQAAAMRYTEARLTKIASSMFNDINKNTVDFRDNYDGSEREPAVLPSTFPNILVNGSEGIAVGMATNIPTHNLSEVLKAFLAYLDNPEISPSEITEIIPGPDFPTGGIIINKNVAMNSILTGRGSVKIRGKAFIENGKGDKDSIIITEIPYQVNKALMIEKVVELIKDKRLEGISTIRDESNKEGIRVVVELKRGVQADIVLNYLYQFTPLQSSFPVNMLVLNKGKPQSVNIFNVFESFLEFRIEVIRKRITFLLNDARERAHALIGFCVAIDSIDKVISIIRNSANVNEARERLISEKWPANASIMQAIELVSDRENKVEDGYFKFTNKQVKSILEIRLARLTAMERDKLIEELSMLSFEIKDLIDILAKEERVKSIIREETTFILNEYGVPRKTEILDLEDSDIEDLIPKEEVVISITTNGYIKRSKLSNYNSQNRGGKGKMGMSTLEDDEVNKIIICNSHDNILCFGNNGKVYSIKAYKIAEAALNTKGRAIVNLLALDGKTKITNILSIAKGDYERDDISIIFATKKGNIRRSNLRDFESINSNGKIAIDLDEDDNLIGVELANLNSNILLASKYGLAIRFHINELRIIKSRKSDGVKGMNLDKEDEVVSLCILDDAEDSSIIKILYKKLDLDLRIRVKNNSIEDLELIAALSVNKNENGESLDLELCKKLAKEEQILVTLTSSGTGKRTSAYDYRITGRGGKGIINVNLESNYVIGTKMVGLEDDILLMSSKGKAIRVNASDISIIGRNTKGVRVFNLEKGENLISFSIC